ncbi:hypothetical protein ACHAXT_009460 [Thalassiosira profunda]
MKRIGIQLTLLGQAVAGSHGLTFLDLFNAALDQDPSAREVWDDFSSNELLLDHSHFFQNETGSFGQIYKLGVDDYTLADTPTDLNYEAYSAVGYGLANNIIVKNENGFILIDAGEATPSSADDVVAAFVKEGILSVDADGFVEPPLLAMIYTHNHIDHTGGSGGWLARSRLPACPQNNDGVDGTFEASCECVEVIGHTTIEKQIINTATRTGKIIAARSAYMYGTYIPHPPNGPGPVNNGIGPPVRISKSSWHPPSKTFTETMKLVVKDMGLQMQLRYVPSEASDEIVTFFPARVFVCREIIRHALSSNTARRYQSIDIIRKYDSWCLLPSHGVPLTGNANVQTLLLNFRDAIAYVHDQTLRFIRQGYVPDEIVGVMRLPTYILDNLEAIEGLPTDETPHPIDPRDYLRALYGSVPQSIREMYNGLLGWNQGDPTLFQPLPPIERADRYVKLMGGAAQVITKAEEAYEEGVRLQLAGEVASSKREFQWAAELTINVIRGDDAGILQKRQARFLKARAFLQLASNDGDDADALESDTFSLNPNWRNWYITGAMELVLTTLGIRFPASNAALISPEIQAGISTPGVWVQSWSWRYNDVAGSELDGKSFGWLFLPNTTFWGDETQSFILQVDKQVVRYISDPIEVESMWDGIDYAVETSYQAFLSPRS